MNMFEMMYNQRLMDLQELKKEYDLSGQLTREMLEKYNLLDITKQELRTICGTV